MLIFRYKRHVKGRVVTFALLEVRLFDKSRDSSSQVIDQADCLDAASHDLVLTMGG
jgi:hypothetical protein